MTYSERARIKRLMAYNGPKDRKERIARIIQRICCRTTSGVVAWNVYLCDEIDVWLHC